MKRSITAHAVGRLICGTALVLGAGVLAACGTRPIQGGMVEQALKLVGLQAEAVSEAAKAGKEAAADLTPIPSVQLRIHAGEQLNSANRGQALSLVLKLYKLKTYEDFARRPYDAFTRSEPLSDDVIASREVVLLPGQRYEVNEPLPQGSNYLGVVALFAKPEEFRWRFVFDARQAAKQGITLGAHRCALSVAQGLPVDSPPEALRLAGTSCR